MTEIVDASEIEGLVGAQRHESLHIGRAVSAGEMVYILHSQDCLDHFEDLRDCPFSRALDEGIEPDEWLLEAPVILELWKGWKLVGKEEWAE